MNLVHRKRYPTEFKAQAVELLSAGKPVSQVAEELCIYRADCCQGFTGRPPPSAFSFRLAHLPFPRSDDRPELQSHLQSAHPRPAEIHSSRNSRFPPNMSILRNLLIAAIGAVSVMPFLNAADPDSTGDLKVM